MTFKVQILLITSSHHRPCTPIRWKHTFVEHHSSSPRGGGTTPSLLASSSWRGFSHHAAIQGPSRHLAWLFSLGCCDSKSPGASEKPGHQDDSHPVPGPHRHWTTSHQDVWGQQPGLSQDPHPPTEQQASVTHCVRRLAGLSPLGDFVAWKTLGKESQGLRATGGKKQDWRKECESLASSLVFSLFHHNGSPLPLQSSNKVTWSAPHVATDRFFNCSWFGHSSLSTQLKIRCCPYLNSSLTKGKNQNLFMNEIYLTYYDYALWFVIIEFFILVFV